MVYSISFVFRVRLHRTKKKKTTIGVYKSVSFDLRFQPVACVYLYLEVFLFLPLFWRTEWNYWISNRPDIILYDKCDNKENNVRAYNYECDLIWICWCLYTSSIFFLYLTPDSRKYSLCCLLSKLKKKVKLFRVAYCPIQVRIQLSLILPIMTVQFSEFGRVSTCF